MYLSVNCVSETVNLTTIMKRFSTKGDFQNGKEPLVILPFWPSGDMRYIFLNRWDIAHPVPAPMFVSQCMLVRLCADYV